MDCRAERGRSSLAPLDSRGWISPGIAVPYGRRASAPFGRASSANRATSPVSEIYRQTAEMEIDMDDFMTLANFEIGQRHRRAERDRMIRDWRAHRAEMRRTADARTDNASDSNDGIGGFAGLMQRLTRA